MRERQIRNRPAATVRDMMVDLKLGGVHRWFAVEFNRFFGVDIYDAASEADIIRVSHHQFEFVLYRFERLGTTLSDVLGVLPLRGALQIADENRGTRKPYAATYAEFRRRFVPTQAMLDYYYGDAAWGPYFSRFYKGERPAFPMC